MLDRFGKCPHCGTNLDNGDIKDHLAHMDVFSHKTEEEIVGIASFYGWSVHNPTRFTKLVHISRDDKAYWRCNTCGATYDQSTGEMIPREQIIEEERKRYSLLSGIQQKATF